MITIGIDPDLTASGVSVVEGEQIIQLKSVRIAELVQFVAGFDGAIIKMEDPNLIKPTFPRQLDKKLTAGQRVSIMRKISQDVGKVKASAKLINELLTAAGLKVIMVRPLKGSLKRQAKGDANYFNKVTGWTGRSNEDQRDAALIALWG